MNGAHGVDLFFVISGFVIVWVASDARQGWRGALDFLFARIARIYPLWWLFAAAIAMMFWIAFGTPWNPARLAAHGMDGATHLIHSFLLWPQAHHPVLGVGWTLVHEMYFYAAFAVLILILPPERRQIGILLWACLVILGASMHLTAEFASTFIQLVFCPMTLQFIVGAVVAYVIKSGQRRFVRASILLGVLSWIAAFFAMDADALMVFPSWLSTDGAPFSSLVWQRTLFFGLPSALLVYGLVAKELNGGFGKRIPNPLVTIGDWSYALYLCHVPVISVVGQLTYRPFGADQVWSVGAYLILATAATFAVAALTYHLFERPIIAFFKRHRRQTAGKRDLSLSAPV
ncbi:MAG: acyltransferase [Pseudomonadota bacterium]